MAQASCHLKLQLAIYDMQNPKTLFVLWIQTKSMTKKQRKVFVTVLKEGYGEPTNFANILDQGIEMLFYLEPDVYTQREVQSVVTALREIIVVLRSD